MSTDGLKEQPPFGSYENCILVMQGGAALGAYEAGVFEAMVQRGITPNWVVGISIGAINAAIIAGNPPEKRLPMLRAFWDMVSERSAHLPTPSIKPFRRLYNLCEAASATLYGIPGFFQPNLLPPFFALPGSLQAISFYDTTPLVATLEKLVDFDYVQNGGVRLSLGTVNVQTGESVYFDNTRTRLTPDHVRASGALPPGFPPIEIDGEFYWDGAIHSNTPLRYLIEEDKNRRSGIVFQVDLYNPKGDFPTNLEEVQERAKDIGYASKRLFGEQQFQRIVEYYVHAFRLLKKLPPSLKDDEDAVRLRELSDRKPITLVHLVNRTDTC
ncbi:MAG: patatin-like phospholipase family protein, partial [Syntrophales bacterium]|nr:patatin-like phospholipase family protein [Syntrophales bacterium]